MTGRVAPFGFRQEGCCTFLCAFVYDTLSRSVSYTAVLIEAALEE